MSGSPTKVGLIGCGQISGIYLENSKKFEAFDIVRVADARVEAAKARAAEYDIPRAGSVEELLADPEVEIVINLTPHRAHYAVGMQVVDAGKSVYTEKPLTVYRHQAVQLLARAATRGVRVGGAPDTFFGGASGYVLWRRLADGAQAHRSRRHW